ncbi:hypothetical protein PpBr36_03378 [Pyricularia pennisetigena]|uniref:hypothetical protein n=1 Tax=Pyricularia pennisetigena TaxID=1578925 RepID=UPI0011532BF9|nr:hypothetical protein PpBr36_03378 [Pyricularia pennisetigena]TLS29883.1 hypothetical protein PpBr36_03378 [Pyricularia pennisetigena]
MERKRLLHQLDTPYSAVQWPHVLPEDQDTVLELLCSLLSPLGDYRRAHLAPSRGKRSKKKSKRQASDGQTPGSERVKPPPPELSAFVDVGLASITRCLQENSESSIISSSDDQQSPENSKRTPYAMILVARSGHSSAFHSHFPQMVAMASQSRPDQPSIRLVGFSKSCEDRLSDCLGVPRVSSVALRAGAPLSKPLIEFVRQNVPVIEIPWVKEVAAGYQETKIKTVEASVGRKKQRVAKT